jgi:hypothetical protein
VNTTATLSAEQTRQDSAARATPHARWHAAIVHTTAVTAKEVFGPREPAPAHTGDVRPYRLPQSI